MSRSDLTVYCLCGSQDDRSKNIENLRRKLEAEPVNFQFVKTEFGNIGEDRHKAIQSINTKWVAYIDDDDDFKPGAFNTVLEHIHSHPNDDIFCPLEYEINNGRAHKYIVTSGYFSPTDINISHHIFPMRTDLAKTFSRCMIGINDHCEIAFKASLMLAGYRTRVIPEYLYYWIRNPHSLTEYLGHDRRVTRRGHAYYDALVRVFKDVPRRSKARRVECTDELPDFFKV